MYRKIWWLVLNGYYGTEEKNEVAIRQNQRLLNAVLDNMPMPLIIKDIDDDLKYVFWNKQCELQGGYSSGRNYR